jgi:hypothetical protein
MTDAESFLYDAETEHRRARRTGSRRAARRARDFGQAYLIERTDRQAPEPYDGADALAYDVESQATRIMRERRRKRSTTGSYWRDTASKALKGG